MKKCIWCSKSEEKVEFKKLAHTIPQSLGGKMICINVCDNCNAYFGNIQFQTPSIETVIKEAFNISRARFLSSFDEMGKNKALAKFTSIFFNVNFKTGAITVKQKYKLQKYFQEKISVQLKRGLYKIFLEETERQNGDGHDSKYDFIRAFSRYNLGEDLPLFYFERKYGIYLNVQDDIKHPVLLFNKDKRMKYLVNEPFFYEFELLGHVFAIPTSKSWQIGFDNYIAISLEAKKDFFVGYKVIRYFNEIDLALQIMND